MPLKSFIASLAVCMFFVSLAVRADDCSDGLMAESCACQSMVRSERKPSRSERASLPHPKSDSSKNATPRLANHAKKTVAPSGQLTPRE